MESTPSPDGAAVRVLVADGGEVYRRGLESALDSYESIEIVGEAADGDEALARAAELLPDVVLLDIRLPDGLEVARRLRDEQPSTRVLVLTESEDEHDLYAAVRAGAVGYLLKEASIDTVVGAIDAAARGNSVVAPTMAVKLLGEFNALSRRVAEFEGDVPRLTARELDVLRLVARGLSNRQIANELVVAENTVKNHVRAILEKLRVRSRVEAAMVAVRDKLVDEAVLRTP